MGLLTRCASSLLILTVYGVAQLPSSRCDSAGSYEANCPFLPRSDSDPGAMLEAPGALTAETSAGSAAPNGEPGTTSADNPRGDTDYEPSVESGSAKPADFSRAAYYRNKLEFSLEGGWHPINIPFPLDVFVGDAYNSYPLKYTLVPIFASLRWHLGGPWGPSILRGNFDLTFTGSVTGVARGPESRYFAYLMGIRRNFIPRKGNGRIAPYFDVRLGVGRIDAKGPQGVLYAQGQDLTFTVNMGSGMRYNFNSRYAISAGLNFMHISNLDLSESNGKPNWGVGNYGINVYGPIVGIDIQLRSHHSSTR